MEDDKNDFEWFSKDIPLEQIEEHRGEWIAIKNHEIISSGGDFRVVLENAEKEAKNPFLIKLPRKREILIL